jgi:hypothetical protein
VARAQTNGAAAPRQPARGAGQEPPTPTTKRDQRRETRREQFAQRQEERRLARARARRNQLIRRYATYAAVVVVVGLLIWGAFALFRAPSGSGLHAADGNPVDNIPCGGTEMLTVHYHANLQIYVDGRAQPIPAGIGIIPNTCFYYLHTHQATGMMHIESPNNRPYTLGEFFDIWGQPLSATQVLGSKVDKHHSMVVDVFDASGKMTQVTGDPRQIKLADHETIVILYNSPHVQPKPFKLPAGVPSWGYL